MKSNPSWEATKKCILLHCGLSSWPWGLFCCHILPPTGWQHTVQLSLSYHHPAQVHLHSAMDSSDKQVPPSLNQPHPTLTMKMSTYLPLRTCWWSSTGLQQEVVWRGHPVSHGGDIHILCNLLLHVPPQTYGEEIYEEGQSDNPAQLIPTIPHYDELSVRVVQNCMNI